MSLRQILLLVSTGSHYGKVGFPGGLPQERKREVQNGREGHYGEDSALLRGCICRLRKCTDVKMKVFHMNNLPEDVRRKFTSDIGFVADYLNEGSFEKRKDQKIIHLEALCSMMEALTGDSRFTDRMGEMLKKQEGGREVKMCEYIDMLEARGEARGKEKGKEIGENMLAALLIRLYALGREGDVKLALENKDARKELYQEFTIAGKYQGPGA